MKASSYFPQNVSLGEESTEWPPVYNYIIDETISMYMNVSAMDGATETLA